MARILVVDDNPLNVDVLRTRLEAEGYDVATASDGEEALAAVAERAPDLILLDVMMPKVDGLEVCRRLRADPTLPFTPIILVTARSAPADVVAALDAGGDEYVTKPVDHAALLARVRSMLRIKALQDTVARQAAELTAWNETLAARVESQVAELERLARLRRFLSPPVAEIVLSAGGDALLGSHRRLVAALFCRLRGFAAMETAEPEEAMAVVEEYHRVLGDLVREHEATIGHRTADGLLVLFNDPVECDDPARRAVELALAARQVLGGLCAAWRRRGHALDVGVGVSLGHATLGLVGGDGRHDYLATGGAVSLAPRLADTATPGQIVVSQRVRAAVEDAFQLEELGDVSLEGLSRPMELHALLGPRPPAGVPRPKPNGLPALTEREREVAALVGAGATNRQIAEALVITEGTAKRHVENILGKLDLKTRAQIAAWAVSTGLVGGAPAR